MSCPLDCILNVRLVFPKQSRMPLGCPLSITTRPPHPISQQVLSTVPPWHLSLLSTHATPAQTLITSHMDFNNRLLIGLSVSGLSSTSYPKWIFLKHKPDQVTALLHGRALAIWRSVHFKRLDMTFPPASSFYFIPISQYEKFNYRTKPPTP